MIKTVSGALATLFMLTCTPVSAQEWSKPSPEGLGMLPQLTGKTFTGTCSVQFTQAPDGRYKVIFCGQSYFLIGKNPDGTIAPRFHGPGTATIDGIFEAGPSGLVFGAKRFDTRYYFLQDKDGNFDFVVATPKSAGMRLDIYTKAADPTNPQAAGMASGATFMGGKYRAQAEQALGYSLDDLPKKVQEPSPYFNRPAQLVTTRPAAPGAAAAVSAGREQAAGPRLALVMGNSTYNKAISSLKNPVNDAHAIAAALKNAGFQVISIDNADQRMMKRAMQDFGARLRALGSNATGLFYFAGHGVQARGVNYLVPTDANITNEADIEVEAVAADGVLRQMEESGIGTQIIILDACRNLPVQRAARDGSRGLARMDAPNGSFMAFSTAPGDVAQDGAGLNSPFASALIGELGKPGQPIEQVFRNVRRSVIDATGGKQVPWDSSSLLESFVFTRKKA